MTLVDLSTLQTFVKSFASRDEFIKFILANGILYTLDESLGLMILRYNRENPDCNFNDPFTRFCRGMILDSENNLVCVPPEKHTPLENLEYQSFSQLHVEDFIDGTMINVFYYGDEWHLATRSKIGANGTWFSKKKFSDMFSEAKGNLDFEKFEKNYTYTFVLRHPENRIVTQYETADLVLVQVRDMNTLGIENTNVVKNVLQDRGVDVITPVVYNFTDMEHLDSYLSQLHWQQQGVVIKFGNFRSKVRNQKFQHVKSMRGNTPHRLYCYLELKQNKMIKEYLQYFPEMETEFKMYWQQLSNMTRLLHQTYMNYRVKKIIGPESVPFELRPLIYELHGHHIKSGIKITPDFVNSYFYSLPIKKIIFVVNYQKNLARQKMLDQTEAPMEVPDNTEVVVSEVVGNIVGELIEKAVEKAAELKVSGSPQ